MGTSVAWGMLVASGLIDVAWAYATKRADGLSQPGWTMLSLGLLTLFIVLLTRALQVLPLGTAYAVWTGIGAIGSLTLGIVALGEPAGALRLALAGLVIAGIIGLKLTE